MGALRTLSARLDPRLLAALLLLAAGLLAVALVAVAPLAAAALVFVLAVVGALLAAAPRARRAARPAPLPEPAPTLRLTLADGESRNARPVALPGASEHQLLLTRDGYVVVDAAGEVVHRL